MACEVLCRRRPHGDAGAQARATVESGKHHGTARTTSMLHRSWTTFAASLCISHSTEPCMPSLHREAFLLAPDSILVHASVLTRPSWTFVVLGSCLDVSSRHAP